MLSTFGAFGRLSIVFSSNLLTIAKFVSGGTTESRAEKKKFFILFNIIYIIAVLAMIYYFHNLHIFVMANFLSNLLNKKGRSVLGIDIGSSSIKMVQLSQKGGHPVLETYGELSLGPYAGKGVGDATNLPMDKIIGAINDMLKEKEVNIM